MFKRMMIASLMLFGVTSFSRGQDRFDAEAVRATLDRQFSDLDANDDEQLDENEINGLSGPELEALRLHGLAESFPIPRGGFLTAGLAVAMSLAGRTRNAQDAKYRRVIAPSPLVPFESRFSRQDFHHLATVERRIALVWICLPNMRLATRTETARSGSTSGIARNSPNSPSLIKMGTDF